MRTSGRKTSARSAGMSGEPTVVSVFAGCGGSSLGYRRAGFRELLAIDWDGNAVGTFKLNFPGVPVWKRDIKKVRGKEILEFCSLRKGELDLLDGSPPCQGYSTAGKRQVVDSRNDLFLENIRLIGELEPKVFLIENVPGMIRGIMKGLFKQYMGMLKVLPYRMKCKLMNAKYYGVPQSRRRLIWIGVRRRLGIKPDYPEPRPAVITVGKALNGVLNGNEELEYFNRIRNSKIYGRIRLMRQGQHYTDVKPTWHYSGYVFKRNFLYKPSFTLCRIQSYSSSDGLLHPTENRKHTVSEVKRLSSFPDGFSLAGNFVEQWGQVANAVPPGMIEVIARHVRDRILSSVGNN